MGYEDQLREHLLDLLGGGHAHSNFDKAVAGLSPELRGTKPAGLPHAPWRLLEHLRIAQWDILRLPIDPRHVSPEFPAGCWPEGITARSRCLGPDSRGVPGRPEGRDGPDGVP